MRSVDRELETLGSHQHSSRLQITARTGRSVSAGMAASSSVASGLRCFWRENRPILACYSFRGRVFVFGRGVPGSRSACLRDTWPIFSPASRRYSTVGGGSCRLCSSELCLDERSRLPPNIRSANLPRRQFCGFFFVPFGSTTSGT